MRSARRAPSTPSGPRLARHPTDATLANDDPYPRDLLYVRSWRGHSGQWFRHALQSRGGRIRVGGIEDDVIFDEPDDTVHPAIDNAYRTKYGRYPEAYVQPMVEPDAIAATFRLVPR